MAVEKSELIHTKGLEMPNKHGTAVHSFRAGGAEVCAPGLDATESSQSPYKLREHSAHLTDENTRLREIK